MHVKGINFQITCFENVKNSQNGIVMENNCRKQCVTKGLPLPVSILCLSVQQKSVWLKIMFLCV